MGVGLASPGNYSGCASMLYGANLCLWKPTHLPVEGRWSLYTTSFPILHKAPSTEVEFCTADLQANKTRERSLKTGSPPSCMEPSSSTQSCLMGLLLLIVSATIYRGTRTWSQHRHGELHQREEDEWHQFFQPLCNLSFWLFEGH